MGRHVGPSLIALSVMLLVSILYWAEGARRPPGTAPDASARGSAAEQSGGTSADTESQLEGLDKAVLENSIRQLETALRRAPATSVPDHYAKIRGLGPKVSAETLRTLTEALESARRDTEPTQTELAHALLEAHAPPRQIGVVQLLKRAPPAVELDDSQLARELELRALLERQLPAPERQALLSQRFTLVLNRLEHVFREGSPLSLGHWQLVQALFRSAPRIHDAHLTPQLRRVFALCARTEEPREPTLLAARVEALATAAVAGMGRHESVRRSVAASAANLLQLLNEQAPDSELARASMIRSLRLAERAVFANP